MGLRWVHVAHDRAAARRRWCGVMPSGISPMRTAYCAHLQVPFSHGNPKQHRSQPHIFAGFRSEVNALHTGKRRVTILHMVHMHECADQGSHHQGSHRGLLTIDQAGPGTGPVPPQAITVAINRQTRSTTLLKQGINTTRPFVDLSICGRKRPPSTHQTNRRPGSTGLSTTLFTAAINWAGSDLAVYRSTGWIKVG